MTVRIPRIFPLRQARARRSELPRYLKLDINRSLLIAVVMLCLMSLIALGQTGVVATKGYAIVELERRQVELLRIRSELQLRFADAQDLKRIEARAVEIGLYPGRSDQVRYITIVPPETVIPEMAEE